MSTTEAKTDLEAVFQALAEKRPLDPEIAKRIHDRAAEVRLKFDHEVSVEVLRSIRNE
ncbi:MAG TPA: hypothetical protein VHV55_01830 [Pirellulales bacterium]|jgi:hypothetical protein|nr:hypothetical protein [Pirellulales bacterium]